MLFPGRGILLKLLRPLVGALGYQLLPRHYYQPFPDRQELAEPFLQAGSAMAGVAIDAAAALQLLEQVFPPYLAEFRALVPESRPASGGPGFWLINGTFMAIDAHVYYALIRHLQPRRIVEIGGGNSSVLAGLAVERNRREGGRETRLTVIEPYPGEALRRGFPGLGELLVERVQTVPLTTFAALEAGDILFIDSSHVLRAGGDVQYEYLEILPRLAPGVLVHIHDISLPRPYPAVYAEQQLYWNEQYLLQAFLAFNRRFEVLWPGNWLLLNHPAAMRGAFPELELMRRHFPQSEPTSFWLRVRPEVA